MNLSPSTTRHERRVLSSSDTTSFKTASIAGKLTSTSPPVTDDEREHIGELLAQARLEGIALGREQALIEEADKQQHLSIEAMLATARQLEQAADKVSQERQRLLDEVVDEVIDLAFGLLRTLVDEELDIREDPARDAVRRALRLAPTNESLVVRVHPSSGIDAVELRDVITSGQVKVVIDPSIDIEGCVVEAGPLKIDAQFSTALERVRLELAGLRPTEREAVPA